MGATVDVEAIYESGVFKPIQPLSLKEGQRVRLRIEPLLTSDEAKRMAESHLEAWQRLLSGLSETEIAEIETIALDRRRFSRHIAEEA